MRKENDGESEQSSIPMEDPVKTSSNLSPADSKIKHTYDDCLNITAELQNIATELKDKLKDPGKEKKAAFLSAVEDLLLDFKHLEKSFVVEYLKYGEYLYAGLEGVRDLLRAFAQDPNSLTGMIMLVQSSDPNQLWVASSQLTRILALGKINKNFASLSKIAFSVPNYRPCIDNFGEMFYSVTALNSQLLIREINVPYQETKEAKENVSNEPSLVTAIEVITQAIQTERAQFKQYSKSQWGALADLIGALEFTAGMIPANTPNEGPDKSRYLAALKWNFFSYLHVMCQAKPDFLTALSSQQLDFLQKAGFPINEIHTIEKWGKSLRITQLCKWGVLKDKAKEVPWHLQWDSLYLDVAQSSGETKVLTRCSYETLKDPTYTQGSFLVNQVGPYLAMEEPEAGEVADFLRTFTGPDLFQKKVVGIVGLGRKYCDYTDPENLKESKDIELKVFSQNKNETSPFTWTHINVMQTSESQDQKLSVPLTVFHISIADNTQFVVTHTCSSYYLGNDLQLIAAKDLNEAYRLSEKGLLAVHSDDGVSGGPSTIFTFLILDHVFTPNHSGNLTSEHLDKIVNLYAYLCSRQACTRLTRAQFLQSIKNALLFHQYELHLQDQGEKSLKIRSRNWEEITEGINPFAYRVIVKGQIPVEVAISIHRENLMKKLNEEKIPSEAGSLPQDSQKEKTQSEIDLLLQESENIFHQAILALTTDKAFIAEKTEIKDQEVKGKEVKQHSPSPETIHLLYSLKKAAELFNEIKGVKEKKCNDLIDGFKFNSETKKLLDSASKLSSPLTKEAKQKINFVVDCCKRVYFFTLFSKLNQFYADRQKNKDKVKGEKYNQYHTLVEQILKSVETCYTSKAQLELRPTEELEAWSDLIEEAYRLFCYRLETGEYEYIHHNLYSNVSSFRTSLETVITFQPGLRELLGQLCHCELFGIQSTANRSKNEQTVTLTTTFKAEYSSAAAQDNKENDEDKATGEKEKSVRKQQQLQDEEENKVTVEELLNDDALLAQQKQPEVESKKKDLTNLSTVSAIPQGKTVNKIKNENPEPESSFWISDHWWEHAYAPVPLIAAAVIEGMFLADKFFVDELLSQLWIVFIGGLIGAIFMGGALCAQRRYGSNLPEGTKKPTFIACCLALALVGPALAVEFVPVLINSFSAICPGLGQRDWELFAGFVVFTALIGALGQALVDNKSERYHEIMGRGAPLLIGAFLTSTLLGVPLAIELMPTLVEMASHVGFLKNQTNPRAFPGEILTVMVIASAVFGALATWGICRINEARGNHYALFPYSKGEGKSMTHAENVKCEPKC